MKTVFKSSCAALAWCVVGVAAATSVDAQSTQTPAVGTSNTATPAATPAAVAQGTATAQSAGHNAAPKPAPSKRSVAAGTAARPPRPTMGLKLTMTQPKSSPMTQGMLPTSRYQNTHGSEKADRYYSGVWGVDKLKASYTNSGNLIKFSYRVLQPKRAKTLGDHENTPELIGIRSNAVLHIPTMEKIGQLRQMTAAEADKEYWMVFSNKGNLVKPGDEVSVIIGKFRADGLIVE